MKHKHHIIPKHLGGTDDPSNLIELTVEEHALWHWCEWQRTGSPKQYTSWQLLRGLAEYKRTGKGQGKSRGAKWMKQKYKHGSREWKIQKMYAKHGGKMWHILRTESVTSAWNRMMKRRPKTTS